MSRLVILKSQLIFSTATDQYGNKSTQGFWKTLQQKAQQNGKQVETDKGALEQWLILKEAGTAEGNFEGVFEGASEKAKQFAQNTDLSTASITTFIAKEKEAATVGGMLKSTFANLAQSMLTAGANMLAMWAVNAVITGLNIGFDALTNGVSKANKKLQELSTKWGETATSTKEAGKILDDYSEKYEKLSKGVNTETGENVSLSESDYNEWLSINAKIANSALATAEGVTVAYDAQGNAIVHLSDSMNSLADAYDTLEQQARQEILKDLPDTYKNAKTVVTDGDNWFADYWQAITSNTSNSSANQSAKWLSFLKDLSEQGLSENELRQEISSRMIKGNIEDINAFNKAMEQMGLNYRRYLSGEEPGMIGPGMFTSAEGVASELAKSLTGARVSVAERTQSGELETGVSAVRTQVKAIFGQVFAKDTFADIGTATKDVLLNAVSKIAPQDLLQYDDWNEFESQMENIAELFGNQQLQSSLSNLLSVQKDFMNGDTDYSSMMRAIPTDWNKIPSFVVNAIMSSMGLGDDSKYTKSYGLARSRISDASTADESLFTRGFIDFVNSSADLSGRIVTMAEAQQKYTDYLNQTATAIETLSGKYDTLSKRQSNAAEVLKSAGTDGTLSLEDYNKLIAANSKYAAAVKSSFGQMQVDYSKVREINLAEIAEQQKLVNTGLEINLGKQADVQEQINNLIVQGVSAEDERYKAQKKQLQLLQQEANQYKVLAAEYTYAASSYKRWLDSKDVEEASAGFNEGKNAIDEIESGRTSGRRNTEAYQAAVEYIFGDKWKGNATNKGRMSMLQNLYDDDGYLDLNKGRALWKSAKLADGTKLINSDGSWNSNNLSEIANALQLSEEFTAQMIKAFSEYNGYQGVDIDESLIEQANKVIENSADSNEQIKTDTQVLAEKVGEETVATTDLYTATTAQITATENLTAATEDLAKTIQQGKKEAGNGGEEPSVEDSGFTPEQLRQANVPNGYEISPSATEKYDDLETLNEYLDYVQEFAEGHGLSISEVDQQMAGILEEISDNTGAMVETLEPQTTAGATNVAVQAEPIVEAVADVIEDITQTDLPSVSETPRYTAQFRDGSSAQYQPTDKAYKIFGDEDAIKSYFDWVAKQAKDALEFAGLDSSGLFEKIEPEISITPQVKGADQAISGAIDEADTQVEMNVDADASSAEKTLAKLRASVRSGATFPIAAKVNGQGVNNSFASGTKNAPGGTSLVGEAGREIWVDTKRNKWTLVDAPSLLDVGKGDIIYNNKQTEQLLRGNNSVSGKAYLLGTVKKREQELKGQRVGKTTTTTTTTTTSKTPSLGSSPSTSSGSSSSSSSSSASKSSILDDLDNMYDFIAILLDNTKEATEDMIDAIEDYADYISKNDQIGKALDAVNKEIQTNQKAYDGYIAMAQSVQEELGIPPEMVKRIEDGTLAIEHLDDDTKESVEEYKKWYDLAQDCLDTVEDLKDTEHDLQVQRIDNIYNDYKNRIDEVSDREKAVQEQIKLEKQIGKEVSSKEYKSLIADEQSQLDMLQTEYSLIQRQFTSLVASGQIQKGSQEWHDYRNKLEQVSSAIVTAKINMSQFNDEIYKLDLNKLKATASTLQNVQKATEGVMDLHNAQGTKNIAAYYDQLIGNAHDRIANLQEQNRLIEKQMAGLDKNSDKYQEYLSTLRSNNSEIMSLKSSQEQWNDSIADLKITTLQDERDALEKINEEYEKQLEYEEALQALQKAKNQRNKLVYVEGQGFQYQADTDALDEAQKRLDELNRQRQTEAYDDAIDALEKNKEFDNVWNYSGDALAKASVIDTTSMSTLAKQLLDSVGKIDTITATSKEYEKVANMMTNKNGAGSTVVQIGDINLSGVDKTEDLAKDIVQRLPTSILQELYKK